MDVMVLNNDEKSVCKCYIYLYITLKPQVTTECNKTLVLFRSMDVKLQVSVHILKLRCIFHAIRAMIPSNFKSSILLGLFSNQITQELI